MAKTTIAPIIAVIVLVLQAFGVEIGEDVVAKVVDWAVTGIALGTTLYGIFKNHKKKGEVA